MAFKGNSITPKHKLALVVASADGIMSLQSGVGIVVNFFFEAYEEICEALPSSIDLYAMCPQVNPSSRDYDQGAFALVHKKTEKFNGTVIPIPNLSSGESLNEIWKGTKNYTTAEVWDSCCKGLGDEIDKLNEVYERIILLVHDTLFVNVSNYVRHPSTQVCWIPHSLGTLFKDPNQAERIRFEKEKINSLILRGDKVGYISNFTKSHLILQYGIKKEDLVSFYSGIYFKSKKYENTRETKLALADNNIPIDKKIIFTWGRCSDQKGIDIIIDAYSAILKERPEFKKKYHLVLLCPTETTYKDYLTRVLSALTKIPKDSYTFITQFQEKLQYEILSYKNLESILLCSRYESFGLTSIEAIYKGHQDATIIYSPLPTFKEVFELSKNAIPLEENSVENLKAIIIRVSEGQKLSPCYEESLLDLQDQFSIVKNYSLGLSQLIAQ